MAKRTLKLGFLSALALSLSAQAYAEGFEYHGYLRVGTGNSKKQTQNSCYTILRQPGYNPNRLGNECGFYMESIFTHTFKKDNESDKPWFKTTLNLALVSDNLQSFESTSNGDFQIANREVYVEAGNVVSEDSVLWIGKRFYKRRDIHMFDFFLLESVGVGGGLYDQAAGPGKLALAYLQYKSQTTYGAAPDTSSSPLVSSVDVRYDLPLGERQNLETALIWGQKSGKPSLGDGAAEFEKVSGANLTFIYGVDFDKASSNRVFVQYGQGLFGASLTSGSLITGFEADGSTIVKGAGSGDLKDRLEKSSTVRVADDFVYNADLWEIAVGAVYQNEDFGGWKLPDGTDADNRVISMIGVRPSYYLSKFWKVTLDSGYTTIKNNYSPADAVAGSSEQQDNKIFKNTIALQVSPASGYGVRPSLRFFVTQADWDKDSQAYVNQPNGAVTPIYGTDTDGTTYGIQAEAWW